MTDGAYMLEAGGPKADERFCHECGVRDGSRHLSDRFKYGLDKYWMFGEQYVTRCEICKNLGRQPLNIEVGICKGCYEKMGGRDDKERKAWRQEMEGPEFREDVEVKQPLTRPLSLSTLPPELLLAVIDQLESDDRLVLCGVSRLFISFIPKLTHNSELLAIERDERNG